MHFRLHKKTGAGFVGSGQFTEEKVVEEVVVVVLNETVTEILFKLPSFIAASDVREVSQVDERNARYESVIAAHKNPDAFTVKAMQTINYPTKVKEEMTAANALRDSGSQVSAFDILDDTRRSTAQHVDIEHVGEQVNSDITVLDEAAGVSNYVKKFVCDTLSVALAAGGCLLDTTTVNKPEFPDARAADTKKELKVGKAKKNVNTDMGGTSTNGEGNTLAAPPSQQIGSLEHSGGQLSGGASGFGGVHGGISTAGDSQPSDRDRSDYAEPDSLLVLREKQANTIMSSKSLLKKMQLVERAVQQNAYHKKHLDYRDLPDISSLSLTTEKNTAYSVDSPDQLLGGGGFKAAVSNANAEETEKSNEPDVEALTEEAMNEMQQQEKNANNGVSSSYARKLFSWANIELVRGRAVTAMAANTANNDILAVGYGKLDTIPNEGITFHFYLILNHIITYTYVYRCR